MTVFFYHVLEVSTEARTLAGCAIDRPRAEQICDGRLVDLEGWVLGRGQGVVAVEVCLEERVIRRVPLGVPRSDVARDYPATEAATCGFRTTLALSKPGPLTLELRAVGADQQRHPFGQLRLEGRWRGEQARPALISVIIPCYNQAHFLDEAIESALAQRYPHVEVAVIDDGSADNTAEIVSRYPGVRYVRQPNVGLAEARNAGVRHSSGSYLVFLDADDRLLPGALQTHHDLLEAHPVWAFVSGQHRLVDFDGAPIWDWRDLGYRRDGYPALLRRNYIPVPGSVMYRRALFERWQFDGSINACADYDLYLRVAAEHPVGCHDELVVEYRRHGGSMTRDPGLMRRQALTALRRRWPHVRADPRLRQAYCEGLVFWWAAEFEAEELGRVAAGDGRGPWQELLAVDAVRDLLTLGRFHPRGLARLLTVMRRS